MERNGKTCDHMSVHVYTLPEASILGILKDQCRRSETSNGGILHTQLKEELEFTGQMATHSTTDHFWMYKYLDSLDAYTASWYDMSFGWKPLKLCKLQDAIDVVSTSVKSHPHWKHWQLWSYPLHWITARFLCAKCHSQAMALAMSYVIIPITTCV